MSCNKRRQNLAKATLRRSNLSCWPPAWCAPVPLNVSSVSVVFAAKPSINAVPPAWPMSFPTRSSVTSAVLTAHLVMPGGHPGDEVLANIAHALPHRFEIGHATLQVETGAEHCRQAIEHGCLH